MHRQNDALVRAQSGRLALGAGIRFARTVDVGMAMKAAGFDWLFIDLEHSSIDLDTAAQMCMAGLDAPISPYVRVPRGDLALAARLLDNGAIGIVMPHVEDAAEAAHIVQQLRLPPHGIRSYSGQNPQMAFRSEPRPVASAFVESLTAIVVMLESGAALRQVDAIAAVPGVDVVMIGTNDFSTDIGIPGEYDHPAVEAAYASLIAACQRHGKIAGVAGIDGPLAEKFIRMGCRFVLAGTDLGFLMNGAHQRSAVLRNLEKPR